MSDAPTRSNRGNPLLMASVAVSTVVVGIAFSLYFRRDTFDAYRDIEVGMSETEVAVLLGRPPGDYSRTEVSFCCAMDEKRWRVFTNSHFKRSVWVTDQCLVQVAFDAEGRVVDKFYTVDSNWTPGPLDLLHRFIRRTDR